LRINLTQFKKATKLNLTLILNNSYYFYSIFTFALSLMFTYLLLKESIIPNHYSLDVNQGSQKIHDDKIKRIGGLSIVFSIIVFLIIEKIIFNNITNPELYFLFLYCFIIFLIGFLEDLIKDIKPVIRLLLLFIFTYIWIIQSNNIITHTNIDFIDNIIEIKILGIILTLICIISSINAANMMDGVNGLLTIFIISVVSVLSFYAFNENKFELLYFLSVIIGSLFGFLIFNWPKGLIFLGDGGSYFLGSLLSTLLIFISNHLDNFSMLNALIIMSYPIWELLFTVLRRLYFSSKITKPDNLHLHTIIHANIKRLNLIKIIGINNNAFSAIIINLIALLPSIIFLIYKFGYNLEDRETIIFLILCNILYTILYLILRKKNQSYFNNPK